MNYPDLTALFAHLGIETVASCMSFAVTADAGRFEWKGGGGNWRETRKACSRSREPAVAVLSMDAPRHPDLQHPKRGRPCRRQTGGLTLGEYFAAASSRRGY